MLIEGKVFWLCSRSHAGVILLIRMGEHNQPSFLGFQQAGTAHSVEKPRYSAGPSQCLRFNDNTGSEQKQQRST